MRRPAFGILTVLLFLFASNICPALAPETDVSQYAHTAWRTLDGYFTGTPLAIAQTTDGYLWIGTESGLFRFDGSRFVAWKSSGGKRLPSSSVVSLLGARDGSLWIGTRAGVVQLLRQTLIEFPDFHDSVYSILEDSSDRIWVSSFSRTNERKSPLCEAIQGSIRCLGKADGVSLTTCCGGPLVQDGSRNIWVGTDRYLLRWQSDSSTTYLPRGLEKNDGLEGVNGLAAAPNGSIWVGMSSTGEGRGLQNFVNGVWKPVVLPGFDSRTLKVITLLLDSDGALWVGTLDQGIYHIHGRHVDRFRSTDGLTANFIQRLYEDREGGIWAVTSRGIDHFHRLQVTTFSTQQGLNSEDVDSVFVSRDDTVWISSFGSLDSIKQGHVTSLRSGKGLPGTQVTSLFEDHSGQLWVGVDQDLYTYTGGRFRRIRRTNGRSTRFIVGITEDNHRDIWAEVNGSERELIRIRNYEVADDFPEAVVPSARPLAADGQGAVWLGLRDGNLAKFSKGRTDVFHFPHNSPSEIRQVVISSDGAVFGTTRFGLLGHRNGKSQILTTRNGLPCDGVIGLNLDKYGALWLFTECGLARIDRSEIERWWAYPNTIVHPLVLDASDGVQPGVPAFNPAAKTSDGRLWFANGSLLQTIDPGHLIKNEVVPPVQLEGLVADRRSFAPVENLRLPARVRDLEIDYTALSFIDPRKVMFRYKLEGRDTVWQDAGTRRQAFYTDLPPGRYRFRVIACNNDGLWNVQGASTVFSVPAAWYQTTSFRITLVVLALVGIWLFYQVRMRQLASVMEARFDERLAERTRLARDLHDTFLQTLQGSKLVADDALERLTDPVHMRSALERLSDWSTRAADEARAALTSLRTSTQEGNDLDRAFRQAFRDYRSRGFKEAVVIVSGKTSVLHPIVRDEVFRIGEEAIRNAIEHSGASRLGVFLTYANNFALSIRDNGQGIYPEIIKSGKTGHFGLRGMRERATRVNGQLDIISSRTSGTSVTLVVPGHVAFRQTR